MDRELLQKDLGKILEVTEETLTNWENNYGEPQIQHFPKIIAFLGFLPLSIDTSTLGGRIKHFRYTQGLSNKKMGKILRVDASTIGSWETNVSQPQARLLHILLKVLNQIE